jgi:hypothetical protein
MAGAYHRAATGSLQAPHRGYLTRSQPPQCGRASLALFEQFRAVVRLKMTLQAFWARRGLRVGANI